MQQRGRNLIAALTISVAIIAFLVIGYFSCCGQIVHTHAGNTRAYIRIFSGLIEEYRTEKGRYPSTLEDLVREGYIREAFRDSWGNTMQYRYPSQRQGVAFELWSLGADGKTGGDGDNTDIGNWKQ